MKKKPKKFKVTNVFVFAALFGILSTSCASAHNSRTPELNSNKSKIDSTKSKPTQENTSQNLNENETLKENQDQQENKNNEIAVNNTILANEKPKEFIDLNSSILPLSPKEEISKFYKSFDIYETYHVNPKEAGKLAEDVDVYSLYSIDQINKVLDAKKLLPKFPESLENAGYRVKIEQPKVNSEKGEISFRLFVYRLAGVVYEYYSYDGDITVSKTKVGDLIEDASNKQLKATKAHVQQEKIDASGLNFTIDGYLKAVYKKNEIPANTPYAVAHDLSFSLRFINSGGYNANKDGNGSQPFKNLHSYTATGTSWLFDYNTEKISTDKGFIWTGYFATNIHVADGLLNTDDNDPYKPPKPTVNKEQKLDTTVQFSLGKFDNSNHPLLSSTLHETYLSYVKLKNLPKTQFAAINFFDAKTKVKVRSLLTGDVVDTSKREEDFNPYIDFAVLAISINVVNEPLTFQEEAEKAVYDSWITPAITRLNTFKSGKSEDQTTKKSLFDDTNYIHSDRLKEMRGFVAGYPVLHGFKEPYNVEALGLEKRSIGSSPIWSLNSYGNNLDQGQPFDVKNKWDCFREWTDYGTPLGMYNQRLSRNWVQEFRGKKYRQYGFSYVLHNTNLSGGSSGSMLLNQNNQIMGIYFGTFGLIDPQGNNISLSLGLANALRMDINPNTKRGRALTEIGLKSYDLINGTDQMINSYKTSLGNNKDTFLYPKHL